MEFQLLLNFGIVGCISKGSIRVWNNLLIGVILLDFALRKRVKEALSNYVIIYHLANLWRFGPQVLKHQARALDALNVINFNVIVNLAMASEESSTLGVSCALPESQGNVIHTQTSTVHFSSPIKVNSNVITLQTQSIPNAQYANPLGQQLQVSSKNAVSLSAADVNSGLGKNALSQPLVIASLAGTVSVGESTAQQFIMSQGTHAQTQFVQQNNPQMLQLVTGNVLAGGSIQIQQNAPQYAGGQAQLRGSQPLRFALAPTVAGQGVSLLQPQMVQRGQLNQGNQIASVQGATQVASSGNPYNGLHAKGTVLSVANNQNQAIFINSLPAITRPILPKTAASPEKKQLLVPLSLAGNVRPIAPRTNVVGNVNQVKLQPQLFPKVNSQQVLVQGQPPRAAVINPGAAPTAPTYFRVYSPQLLPYFTQVRPRMPPSSPVQPSFSEGDVPSSPTSDLAESKAPRKPCNCTKSQCLKLYCDCFANGEFCSDCNCQNCANNIEHEEQRSKAIKNCLERNPQAFHPKIGKGRGVAERRHNKGCHCKRSGCLKNYCECYEAKILCTQLCKCTGCKNFEESPERKTLMHLADAAEVRVLQQNAAKTKLELQMENLQSRNITPGSERLPFSFITGDVAKATSDCLLSRVEELMHDETASDEKVERAIIEEFGRCILQVIQTSCRTRGGYTT